MTRFRTITAGVLIAGLLGGGVAYAQGGPGGPGGRGALGARGLSVRGLNLTDAQQQQVRDIRERHRDAIRQAEQRVREALQAQRQAVSAVPINEGQIRATTFALAEAQTEAAIQQARVSSEIWSALTPEQQAQLEKRRAERAARADRRGARQPRAR